MACKKISEKQGHKDTASPVKPNLWHQEDRTSNSVNTESKIQALHDIYIACKDIENLLP